MGIEASDRCKHCGEEFADHNYVPNSIDQYECPRMHEETGYGFFHGGDPRDFYPSPEDCLPEELENHRKACERFNEAEARGQTPKLEENPSGWVQDEKGVVCHILRTPYGVGIYKMRWQTFFEPVDYDDSEDYLDADLFGDD